MDSTATESNRMDSTKLRRQPKTFHNSIREAKAVVATMISSQQIPFSLGTEGPDQPALKRGLMRRSAFTRHRSEDDIVDDDQTELDHNNEEGELSRAVEQSFSQSAVAFESVPASKLAVEALEKFRYERSSEDERQTKSV
ncbi:hypothetical protein TIFTF001_032102 [Ficus carica]|uniref:Uncharacterized protein n=1 Tax=Ficus carica TaxID=3494 RepID=A0AA88J627_FICCA|nr:hypothetical protein TIFTF001_032102 [Ficus carica]